MGVLDEIISKEQAPAAKPAGKREAFPSATTDNAGRIGILQSELEQEKKNLTNQNPEIRNRAQSNIDAISREIAAINGQKMPAQPAAQQTAPQPTGGVLDEIIQKEMPAAVGAPVGRSDQDMVGADNTNQPLYPREDRMLPPVEVTDTFLPMTDFGKGVAAVIDNTVGGILPFVTKQGSYLIGRTISDLGRITGVGETKTPEQIDEESNRLAAIFSQPIGKIFGINPNDPAYKGEVIGRFFELLGENTKESAQNIRLDLQRKGVDISEKDIEFLMNSILPKVAEKVGVPVGKVAEKVGQAVEPVVAPVAEKIAPVVDRINSVTDSLGNKVDKAGNTVDKFGNIIKTKSTSDILKEQFAARGGAEPTAALGSAGAAATTNEAIVKQALSVASPELQAIIKDIPVDKVNLPTLTRHLEADSLPIPMRLTEGMATGDVVKISNEQNRRGKDTDLAYRFNELNQQSIENLNAIREIAAPDVYGTKTIENSQSLIDSYKELDKEKNTAITTKFDELRQKAGGDLPVDSKTLLTNIDKQLKQELLKTDGENISQYKELKAIVDKSEQMTFDNYLAMRRNLSRLSAEAKDGNIRQSARIMVQELDKLPLTNETAQLKPIADEARSLAKQRFDALKKDPAYRAAINDSVPVDKFFDKFVINGHHKNIETMVNTFGRDSQAHQHMAAGTVNWLKDKTGIIKDQGNFSQKNYNEALKKLDDVNNLNAIFNPEASTHLKTLGNVSNYVQFQPKGSFVNNSNTLVGALADRAAGAVETGANVLMGGKYGIPIGSIIRGQVKEFKSAKETEKSLAPGAGIRNK
jgi:hypothetical protein